MCLEWEIATVLIYCLTIPKKWLPKFDKRPVCSTPSMSCVLNGQWAGKKKSADACRLQTVWRPVYVRSRRKPEEQYLL